MDFIKLSPFQGVAASGIATLVSDECRGKSIHAFRFKLGGTFTKAMITAMTIRMNGKDILPSISGTQLQLLNTYEGLPNAATYLWWFMGDPTAQTIKGQHLGDLDMSIYGTPLEFRVTIAGATSPTLEVAVLTSVPKTAMGIGFDNKEAAQMRVLVRTVIQPGAAVTRATYSVGYGSTNGGRIRRVNFFHTNLTSVEYRKNSLVKHDDMNIADNASLQAQYARTAQTGLYVLDRVYDGNQGEAETTVDDEGRPWTQQYSITTSAADTIDTYADVISPWAFI